MWKLSIIMGLNSSTSVQIDAFSLLSLNTKSKLHRSLGRTMTKLTFNETLSNVSEKVVIKVI